MTTNQARSTEEKEQKLEEELKTLAQQKQEEKDEKNTPPKEEPKDEDLDDVDDDSDTEDKDKDDDSDESKDDSDKDEEDDSKSDDDDEEEKPIKKGDKEIKVWQHQMELKRALKEQREELEKEFATKMNSSKGDVDVKDEVDKIVEEFKLDPEVGKKFLEKIFTASEQKLAQKFGLDDNFKERIQSFNDKQIEMAERDGFESDFRQNLKVVRKLYPEATQEDIDKIKEKVHELAYSKKYSNYALKDIIRLNKGKIAPLTQAKSIDSNKNGQSRAQVKYNLDDPTSIPWNDLSPEEFEKVSDALAKKSGSSSRIYRKGQRIN